MTLRVATFYRFVGVADPAGLRETLARRCGDLGIKGTILVAPEGINATIAGAPEVVTVFMAFLETEALDGAFAGLPVKYSTADVMPFARLKVRLKTEIVTLRAPEADPSRTAGTYVRPEDWNALISSPDVVLIDVRNTYETAIGSFPGAIDPETETFTDFKRFVSERLGEDKSRPIATFCTGGIRCEKATAYLRTQGFSEVYHLEGGILKYLEKISPEDSRWQGACFVFDERVALDGNLAASGHGRCAACGWPLPPACEPGAAPCGCGDKSRTGGAAEQPENN